MFREDLLFVPSVYPTGSPTKIRHSPSHDALQHDLSLDLAETPVAVKVEEGKYFVELSRKK